MASHDHGLQWRASSSLLEPRRQPACAALRGLQAANPIRSHPQPWDLPGPASRSSDPLRLAPDEVLRSLCWGHLGRNPMF